MKLSITMSSVEHTALLSVECAEAGNQRVVFTAPAISDEIDGMSVSRGLGIPTGVTVTLKSGKALTFYIRGIQCELDKTIIDLPNGTTGLYQLTDVQRYTTHETPDAWDRHAHRCGSPVDLALLLRDKYPDDFHSVCEWLVSKPEVVVMVPNIGLQSSLQPFNARELFNTLKEQKS